MRPLFALLLLAAPLVAQTADEKMATLKFIDSLRDPDTGAYAVNPLKDGEKPKPSLRACNGAVNAIKIFGGELTDKEKLTKFVMGCFDEKTGAFSEPGEKPTVTMTAVGVLAATALDIDRKKYAKAMHYLKANAETFEDYRIGAAAIEAFGVKESAEAVGVATGDGFALDWTSRMSRVFDKMQRLPKADQEEGFHDEERVGVAMFATSLRLFSPTFTDGLKAKSRGWAGAASDVQLKDGGWGRKDAKTSDAETTYRVMRLFVLLKEKPKDVAAVTKFVASCRRKDGGYGVDADAPGSMSGVYYAAKIGEWVKGMEK